MSSLPLVIVIPLLAGALGAGYAIARRPDLIRLLGRPEKAQAASKNKAIEPESETPPIVNPDYRVSEISREILHASSLSEGLQYLVQLTHERLGYPHVYAYQPEEMQQHLSLVGAAGTTAGVVLRSGHQLPVGGKSLVAQAAKKDQPLLSRASSEDEQATAHLENSLLPGAQAAIAVPLSLAGQLLAVLNIQSDSSDALSDQDLDLLADLANQGAAALKIIALVQEKEILQAKVETLQQQHRQEQASVYGYDGQFRAQPAASYTYKGEEGIVATDLVSLTRSEVARALDNGQMQTRKDDQEFGTSLTVPINLGERVIGALQLRHKDDKTWHAQDIETLRSVIRQLAPAIENARLLEETERRVALEQSTSQIAATIRETLDIETILRTAAQEIRHTLQLPEVIIRLGTPSSSGDPALQRQGEGQTSTPARSAQFVQIDSAQLPSQGPGSQHPEKPDDAGKFTPPPHQETSS